MRKLRERPLQVYLRPDQDSALRRMAEKQSVSLAALIREGVDRIIAEAPMEDDPLLDIIGLGSSGVTDLSERHDYYIVQAIENETSPPRTQPATPRKRKKVDGKRNLRGHKRVDSRRRQKR